MLHVQEPLAKGGCVVVVLVKFFARTPKARARMYKNKKGQINQCKRLGFQGSRMEGGGWGGGKAGRKPLHPRIPEFLEGGGRGREGAFCQRISNDGIFRTDGVWGIMGLSGLLFVCP